MLTIALMQEGNGYRLIADGKATQVMDWVDLMGCLVDTATTWKQLLTGIAEQNLEASKSLITPEEIKFLMERRHNREIWLDVFRRCKESA